MGAAMAVTAPPASSEPSPVQPPSRTRYARSLRTTTGCLTCRLRRKKCEEQKPICIGCQRNHLICTWPSATSASRPWRKKLLNAMPPQTTALVENKIISKRIEKTRPSSISSQFNSLALPPRHLPPGHIRADTSNWLLEHYVHTTARDVSARITPENPFITHILPLAFSNERVLYSILAISSAHAICSSGYPEHEWRSLYAVALRSIKHDLVDWEVMGVERQIGLCVATLLLALCEVVVGNTQGALFYHLRATREVLVQLRYSCDTTISRRLLDFMTELYAFMAVSSFVTTKPSLISRDMPVDSMLCSLSSLNRGSPLYGALFGTTHILCEMIPKIAVSAEEMQHETEKVRQSAIEGYENKIKSWKYRDTSFMRSDGSVKTKANDIDPLFDSDISYRIAGEIYQEALFIFLYSSFSGSREPTQALRDLIDPHVDKTLELLLNLPAASCVATTMMWPTIVAGSCARLPRQQDKLRSIYSLTGIKMLSVVRSVELLDYLWEDQSQDPRLYGIYGLEIAMAKRNFNVCIG
ncbi:fungal-specific transcription factor domain-containing protein [Xylogone sp. PMI_703]|nr:fungal-specific transcription factor domain-containing protein [Xylogone sp. PMI_703]